MDDIIADLRFATESWPGLGYVPPSEIVFDDLAQIAHIISLLPGTPAVEIDESDGAVSLTWTLDERSLVLTLVGDGRVVGTISPWAPDHAPWTLSVAAGAALATRITRLYPGS